MTNRINFLRLRRLAVLPSALLFVSFTTASSGGERRVHVQGGKMLTQMENGKMVLKGIQGDIGGGKILMSGNVADGAESNNATVKFKDVPLEKAATMLGKKDLSGWMGNLIVTGFIEGEWSGKGVGEITRTADGAMVLQTGPGVISDKAILEKIGKATGVSDLSSLAYDQIKIQARARDGKIALDFIRAEGPDFKLESKGSYDAASDNLNVRINATVSQELAAKSSYMKLNNVMSFLRGEAAADEPDVKFVEIPRLVVSGELKKPTVGLDKQAESGTKVADAGADAAKTPKQATPNVKGAESLKKASKFLTQSLNTEP